MASKDGALEFPPDLEDGVVYQDEWVAYLRYGSAQPPPAPVAVCHYFLDGRYPEYFRCAGLTRRNKAGGPITGPPVYVPKA